MLQMRASTAERQAYADLLANAYAEGRLDYEEFHERQDALYRASTHQEIRQLFEGLPFPSIDVLRPAQPQLSNGQPPQPSMSRRMMLIGGGVGIAALFGAISYATWRRGREYYSGFGYEYHSDSDVATTEPLGTWAQVDLLLAEMATRELDLIYVLEATYGAVAATVGASAQPNIHWEAYNGGTQVFEFDQAAVDYHSGIDRQVFINGLEQARTKATDSLNLPQDTDPVMISAAANRFEVFYDLGSVVLDAKGEVLDVRHHG